MRAKREPYIQYVYHFESPMNSIDVRTISPSERELVNTLYKHRDISYAERVDLRTISELYSEFNTKQAIQLLKDHFPEEII